MNNDLLVPLNPWNCLIIIIQKFPTDDV